MFNDPSSSTVYTVCCRCGRPITQMFFQSDGSVLCADCANRAEDNANIDTIISLLGEMLNELRLIRMKRRW